MFSLQTENIPEFPATQFLKSLQEYKCHLVFALLSLGKYYYYFAFSNKFNFIRV